MIYWKWWKKMKTYIKFKLGEGETKGRICDSIARHMWQFFRLRDIDGKIGEDHTVTNDDLRVEVAKLINKKRWIREKDRLNIDRYQLFIERQTRQAINKLISPVKSNTLFYPGLLNNPFVGYFIAGNQKEVEDVRKEKQLHIDGCSHNLEHRTVAAIKYVKQLPEHQKDLIGDGQEVA